MDLNASADKLASSVEQAKIALAKADAAANRYKITQKHWTKLTAAEIKFNQMLAKLDIPEHLRGKWKALSNQFTILTSLGAFFLIGSTAALWWITKPKYEDEYEE